MRKQRAHRPSTAAAKTAEVGSQAALASSAFALEDPRGSSSVSLLKALHILTRDGQLNQDSRRKLKQVNHLIQLMTEPLRQCWAGSGWSALEGAPMPNTPANALPKPLVLVDHGCGKSYLGFMLHEQFCGERAAIPLEIIGIETRLELVEHAKALAQELNFKGMDFLNISAKASGNSALLPRRVDVVTALHACDTASDDAIEFALAKKAQLVFLVPCCQAELAAKLRAGKAKTLAKTPLAELWRHPLHTREMGSQLTNVLRCLYLESQGYKVSVTELVGWEHSMKNELITATFTGQCKRSAAHRLVALLAQFGLEGMMLERYPRVQAVMQAPGQSSGANPGHALGQDQDQNQNQAEEQNNEEGLRALSPGLLPVPVPVIAP
jgi:hypothetical protein